MYKLELTKDELDYLYYMAVGNDGRFNVDNICPPDNDEEEPGEDFKAFNLAGESILIKITKAVKPGVFVKPEVKNIWEAIKSVSGG